MKLNYELIYKLRKHRINSHSNIRIEYENQARKKADEEYEKTRAAIEKELGHPNFEITSIICLVDGVLGHVFARPDGKPWGRRGHGERVCIFCGCSDFSD